MHHDHMIAGTLIFHQLNCDQKAQTTAKASNLYQMWCGVWIRISGLIRIRIRYFPDHLQNVVDSLLCRRQSFRRVMKIGRWLINLLKSGPYVPQWEKWKGDPESISMTGSPPKVNQFFWLVGIHQFQWNRLIIFCRNRAEWKTEWTTTEWQTNHNDRITPPWYRNSYKMAFSLHVLARLSNEYNFS